MNATQYANVIFAQYSRWKHLGDGLHRPRNRIEFSEVVPYLILIAVIAAVACAVVKYIQYNDLSIPCDNPKKLFREISLAHGLDRGSQRLLRQLASSLGYDQPAEIFVTPAAFDASQLPENLYQDEVRIEELRERLFE